MSLESNTKAATKMRCQRHPGEEVALICGGCAKRICTICLTLTGEGVRCPDCMAQLNAAYYQNQDTIANNGVNTNNFSRSPKSPSVSLKPKLPQIGKIGPNGQISQRDTGFRTYWKRTPPLYLIEPRHYLLAIVAAVISAVICGAIWGILLDANSFGYRGNLSSAAARAYENGLHFLPEIIVGVIVAEAVARITHERRGRNLQIIAGGGVLLAYFATIATLVIRLQLNAGATFPGVGAVWSNTWDALNIIFRGGISIFVFWIIGITLSAMRLKR